MSRTGDSTTTPFAALARARNVSLTTLRRSGQAVATPVWVVVDDAGVAYVVSRGQGKVKRIRNNPAVTMAPCTMRGEVTGAGVEGRAEIVGTDLPADVRRMIVRKYGPFGALAVLGARLAPARRKPVLLRITAP